MNTDEELINQLQSLSQEDFELLLDSLAPDHRAQVEDLYALALAKGDKFKRITYFLKTDKGDPIKLYDVHRLMIDFAYVVWGEGNTPLIFALVGSGKTTIFIGGVLCDEIGKNINLRSQIICASDTEGTKRARLVKQVLGSRHYQKVYPNVKPGMPWNDHQIMIQRTQNADALDTSALGEAMAVDPTVSVFGIGGSALGTRTEFSVGDDLANEENSIFHPAEGDKVYSTVNSKFMTRRVAPIGQTDDTYNSNQELTKFVFLGNTWHSLDPIARMIDEPGKAAIMIGVSEHPEGYLTSYNVRMYGDLSLAKMEELKRKYSIGECEDIEPDKPAKCSFRIPANLPKSYLEKRRDENLATGKWNPTYRTIVFTDAQRAYPNAENSFINGVDLVNGIDWTVEYEELFTKRHFKTHHLGWKAWVRNPPKGMYYIANMDFSGVKREGTVLMVGCMLRNYKRVPVAIYTVGAAGNEQSDLISRAFKDYPMIQTILPEDAGLQVQQADEWGKHPEMYPWVYRIQPFENHGGKRKNDLQLGVLAMATTFANGGFQIADSTNQDHHAKRGSSKFPKGCPCGFCRLIRDVKEQPRVAEVKSDLIMTLWMQHLSFPQYIEMPDAGMASGVPYAESGMELLKPNEITAWSGVIEGVEKQTEKKPLYTITDDGERMSEF